VVSHSIGKKIKEARLEKGTPLEVLAEQINIGVMVLQSYEDGETVLNLDHLFLISKALEKSLIYFIGVEIGEGIAEEQNENPFTFKGDYGAISIPVINQFYGNEQFITDENIIGEEIISEELSNTIHFASIVQEQLEYKGEIRAKDGDLLLWEQKRWPDRNGQLVAVVLDESASLCWFYQNKEKGIIQLRAVYDSDQITTLFPDEVIIIAVCVGSMVKIDDSF
jgi:transcriptional regulator with XRE-family HTH domain